MGVKKIFARGLRKEFVDRLNEVSIDKNHWWNKIKADGSFFVGIRDDYLNIYFNGNSLVKLWLLKRPKGVLRGDTHEKYLRLEGDKCIASRDGVFCFNKNKSVGVPKTLSGLEQIKNNASANDKKKYKHKSGVGQFNEKTAIQKYLENSSDIIDVEIAISTSRYKNYETSSQGSHREKIPRIDIVQLTNIPGQNVAQLDFIEAKLIENSELKTEGKEPKVIEQLKRYRHLLKNKMYINEFENTYFNVCENITHLGLSGRAPLAADVACGKLKLKVNPRPILLVFKGDMEPHEWTDGVKHFNKLERCLRKISCEYRVYDL